MKLTTGGSRISIRCIFRTRARLRTASLSVGGLDGIEIAGERIVEVPASSLKSIDVTVRADAQSGNRGSNQISSEVVAMNHERSPNAKATFLLP